jgi:starch phosphorylase
MEHDVNSEDPDGSDAEKIYRLLEEKIVPIYYQMSENGIPLEWVRLMKETIKSAAAGFSARRMVRQYIEKFYSTSIKNALEG